MDHSFEVLDMGFCRQQHLNNSFAVARNTSLEVRGRDGELSLASFSLMEQNFSQCNTT
jgi:hypothetical protein